MINGLEYTKYHIWYSLQSIMIIMPNTIENEGENRVQINKTAIGRRNGVKFK